MTVIRGDYQQEVDLVVELRVVESIQQVDGAGTRRCEAHAHLARELGVRAGHEGRHLFVTYLDEPELLELVEAPHDSPSTRAVVGVRGVLMV